MSIFDRFKRNTPAAKSPPRVYASDGGRNITTPKELEAALLGAIEGGTVAVSKQSAMQVGAVFGCVRILSGAVANVPLHIKRRVNDGERQDATDAPAWKLLRQRPNHFQTARQFRKILEVDVLTEGNAYAHITRAINGDPIQLIRLDPTRMKVTQSADLSKVFDYTSATGVTRRFTSAEIMHLFNLSLDGITGINPIRYAREAIGDSLSMAHHGSEMFRNGARVAGALQTSKTLGAEGIENLKASLETFRAGGDNAGKDLILEDGLEYKPISINSADAQWMEARSFSRSDIAMFYGVPPHMIGVLEKSTSWGTGIEEQTLGFLAFTLEDYFTMFEDGIDASLFGKDRDLYARHNRSALVRSDSNKRKDFYTSMLQWGVLSPNEVRALEDKNPRAGGDEFYLPPNTAGEPPKGA